MTRVWDLVKTNWLIIVVVMVATWLRVWQLDTHAIFFGDAARDVMVAAESLQAKTVPLLGIPSSVPRFKQGPVAIWIEMLTMSLFGESLFAVSLVFALISVAAVIMIYELVTVWVSRTAGVVAAWLVATSPLAVAHGRMPYHTNPIPLASALYLWSLMLLWQKKPKGVLWAALAWAFLFQFELALLPLILLIPLVLWRSRQRVTKSMLAQGVVGLAVGLAPQIIYDLTHSLAQLGTFVAWVGYRLGSSVVPGADHSFGWDNLIQTMTAVWVHVGRIVSADVASLKVVGLGLLLVSAVVGYRKFKKRKLPHLVEVTWAALGLLIVSFLIHGSPSEAYFPVFITLVAVVIGYGVMALTGWSRWLAVGAVMVMGIFNVIGVLQHSFFVSNQQPWSYGSGVAEQRDVVQLASNLTEGSFYFETTQVGKEFPAFFDNYRWWARQHGTPENLVGQPVFIESKQSDLQFYPDITKHSFTVVDVYLYD